MKKLSPAVEVVKKPFVLISGAVLVVVVLVWALVFFMPQSHKLSTLQSERASLQQTVVQDDARLQQVRKESHHVGQIQALYSQLQGYVPPQEELYTYIQTLSGAAKSAGVTIVSLQPGTLSTASGTPYSAIPITANLKGTYDQLLSFLRAIYTLPRLTDINTLDITGGGPGTNRSSSLTATLDLSIFTSQKASPS